MSKYTEERAKQVKLRTRDVLKELPDVCSEFIQAIEFTTEPLTRYGYTIDLRTFVRFLVAEIPEFADKTPADMSADDFERVTIRHLRTYTQYLDLYIADDAERSNNTVGKMRKLSSLRVFYDYLFKNGYVTADVTKLIDMPKRHEKPIIRLEIDEMVRMLDNAETGNAFQGHQKAYNERNKSRDLAILTLFLGTGIRVSELVGLNISDIDFGTNGFTVTRKGGSDAILYFPEEVAEVLKKYIAERKTIDAVEGNEDALFLSMQKKRMNVRSVEKLVKKYAESAAPLKQHLSPHKLRSTFATNLYHETGDVYLVAEVLGHKDVNTTRRHYAAMQDDARRMAAKKVVLRDDQSITDDEP